MEEKLLDISYRKKIINEIKSDENVQRKIVSYKKMSMQNDNFYQYIKEYLESKLDVDTVSEMDIFANVNLQRRVSKAEACIYNKEPQREFFINDVAVDDVENIYDDVDVNTVLKKANEALKYQEQCAVQVMPEENKLKARVLLPHHYDVIPQDDNPEKALGYVISNFDNTSRDRVRKQDNTGHSQGDTYRDGINQDIADADDANLDKERFFFWSKQFNFVTNGRGVILDKVTDSPIVDPLNENGDIILDENILSPLFEFQCLPFIDIASNKDFEFWVRSGDSLFDATLMYNTIITSEFQVVKMQGHSQAVYKGSADHMPENLRVGINRLLHIPIDPNNPVNSDFQFVNPGSDLAGIRDFRESFLTAFLTSRGLDSSVVSGQMQAQQSSSGVEKLLQMVEKFEASREDFSLFRKVENDLCEIISCYLKSSVDLEYDINLIGDLKCNVEFAGPELMKSEMEKLEILEKELDLQVTSRVHYLMEEKGLDKDQALEKIKEIDEFEQGGLNDSIQTEVLEEEVSQRYNLKKILGYEPSERQKELFADLAMGKIVDRTLSGKDVNGQKFTKYSKQYAKKKGVSRTSVDLTLSGDMLNSITDNKQKNIVKLKIDESESLKAYSHSVGKSDPKNKNPQREFFGFKSEDDLKGIISQVDSIKDEKQVDSIKDEKPSIVPDVAGITSMAQLKKEIDDNINLDFGGFDGFDGDN